MGIHSVTKEDAVAAFDGNSAALARALGITPSAVYQWPEGPIAEGYALKLRFVLKPEHFADSGDAHQTRQPGAAAAAA